MKILRIMLVAVIAIMSASSAHALSSHTWVSGTGSDTTGNGTITKPWATFQMAIDNTAAGGEVSVCGSGDFGTAEGTVINNSITIDGSGYNATIQCTNGEAIAVNEEPISKLGGGPT